MWRVCENPPLFLGPERVFARPGSYRGRPSTRKEPGKPYACRALVIVTEYHHLCWWFQKAFSDAQKKYPSEARKRYKNKMAEHERYGKLKGMHPTAIFNSSGAPHAKEILLVSL